MICHVTLESNVVPSSFTNELLGNVLHGSKQLNIVKVALTKAMHINVSEPPI